jgi:hypothetical protein
MVWCEKGDKMSPSLCVQRGFTRSALGSRVAVYLAVNKTNREKLVGWRIFLSTPLRVLFLGLRAYFLWPL